MTRNVAIFIDGWRGPEVFLKSLPKSPCRFPYVLLIIIQLVTLVPVDYPNFLCDVVPILGSYLKVLNGVAFFKVDLEPTLPQTFLKLSLFPLVYDATMYMLLLLLMMLLWLLVEWLLFWAWLMLCLWLLLVWGLFKTQIGYLHICKALLMCSSSVK